MTSTEALNNFFLSVIIIFTVYFILDLIGNAMLLKSTGQKMWIGFIPVVNDFFIFIILLCNFSYCIIDIIYWCTLCAIAAAVRSVRYNHMFLQRKDDIDWEERVKKLSETLRINIHRFV